MADNKQTSNVPEVFKLIIDNDNAQAAILAKGSAMTLEEWRKFGELRRYRRESLVPGAEALLHWNKDKGNVA